MNRYISLAIFTGLITFSTSVCFAKPINLYDQPKTDAKVIGSIDTDHGIIPIFTPKDGSWVKVGDPQNGNVGWVKQAELQSNDGITFTQHIISTGNGPHAYEVVQYGSPAQMSPDQAQAMIKKIQDSQATMQKAMQQMMKDMFVNIDSTTSYPLIMPVIVVPEKKVEPVTGTTSKK